MKHKLLTREFLICAHHTRGMSRNAIAREVGCANHTVSAWMKRYGIEQLPPKFDNRGLEKSSCWKGHGRISQSYFYNTRKNASMRGHVFDITLEYISELFESQNGKCALSGADIAIFGRGVGSTASLDRIDSSLGYVKGNLWWLHRDVNLAKRSMSVEDFVNLCQSIVTFKSQQS